MGRILWKLGLLVTALGLMSLMGCPGDDVTIDNQHDQHHDGASIEAVDVEPAQLVPGNTAAVTVEVLNPRDAEIQYSYDASEGFEVTESEPGEAELVAADAFGVEGQLTVGIEDSDGFADEMTVDIETRDHDDPVIESIAVVPSQFEPGESGQLEVEATAPYDDELFYEWTAPDDWTVESVDDAQTGVTAPEQPDVETTIEVSVSDEFGGETTASVEVSTRSNEPPEITELTAEPPQVEPGGDIELSAQASDPEGGEVDFAWFAPSDWMLTGEDEPQATLTAPDEYGNTATVELDVTDEHGAVATATVLVSTTTNQGPQIEVISAEPTQVQRGGLIDLSVEATHPDGAELDYDWNAPAGWELIEDSAQPEAPQLQAPDDPGQNATVDVTVTDSEGKEALSSIMVGTHANVNPVVVSLDADPSSVVPEETTTISADAYDPDGEELDYQWDVPDEWSGTSDDETLQLVAPDEYGQSATVTLTVDDGWDTTQASVSVSTVQSVEPNIISFSADPMIVDRQETSSLSVDAEHVYDAPLSYHWETDSDDWTLDAGDDSEATVTAPDAYGHSVMVTVTVEGDYGATVSSSVALQSENNLEPVITGLSADPSVVDRQETSNLMVEAFDPNGEPLNYDWSIDGPNDGEWDLASQQDTATLEAPNIPDDEVIVTVTVDDGYGGVASETIDVVTEPNNPPVIEGIEMSSLDPDDEWVEQGGTADLLADVSNPDGDVLDYQWSVSTGWSVVGDDIDAELTASDENNAAATVELTVSDNWDSDTATFDVRTQDTEPAPFEFSDEDDVDLDTTITSDEVQLEGFDGPIDAVCTGCQVSINGGGFDQTVGDVFDGDTARIRTTSSSEADDTVVAHLTVGDTESAPWSVTTMEFVLTGGGTASDPYTTTSTPLETCLDYGDSLDATESAVYEITNDAGDEVLAYCDMQDGWTYEGVGFGQYETSYSGWEVVGPDDFEDSEPLREAFALHFNEHEGLENVDPGWNSDNCCFFSPDAEAYSFRAADGNEHMYPADFDGERNCNGTYDDEYMKIQLRTTDDVPTSFTPDELADLHVEDKCNDSHNPGIFVKRYQ